MKIKIIQLLCVLVLFGCQKNDIDVFNGSDTNLAKLNGNWIVVNYWADWCAPCIKEIPELNEFAKENDDLLVFTFNFDFLEVDDLEPIAERFNIEVPSLITHPNEIWELTHRLQSQLPSSLIQQMERLFCLCLGHKQKKT